MPSILYVNASPRKADSQSLRLAQLFLDIVREHTPCVEIETLNLFDQGALPVFGTVASQAKMAMFSGQEQTRPHQRPPVNPCDPDHLHTQTGQVRRAWLINARPLSQSSPTIGYGRRPVTSSMAATTREWARLRIAMFSGQSR